MQPLFPPVRYPIGGTVVEVPVKAFSMGSVDALHRLLCGRAVYARRHVAGAEGFSTGEQGGLWVGRRRVAGAEGFSTGEQAGLWVGRPRMAGAEGFSTGEQGGLWVGRWRVARAEGFSTGASVFG